MSYLNPTEEEREFARHLYRSAREELGYGHLADLIAVRGKRVLAARDREWTVAYNGPITPPGLGPRSPEELRIFIEEANQVDKEQREYDGERLAAAQNEAASYKALFEELCEYVAQMCEHFGDKRNDVPCDAWRLCEHVSKAVERPVELDSSVFAQDQPTEPKEQMQT